MPVSEAKFGEDDLVEKLVEKSGNTIPEATVKAGIREVRDIVMGHETLTVVEQNGTRHYPWNSTVTPKRKRERATRRIDELQTRKKVLQATVAKAEGDLSAIDDEIESLREELDLVQRYMFVRTIGDFKSELVVPWEKGARVARALEEVGLDIDTAASKRGADIIEQVLSTFGGVVQAEAASDDEGKSVEEWQEFYRGKSKAFGELLEAKRPADWTWTEILNQCFLAAFVDGELVDDEVPEALVPRYLKRLVPAEIRGAFVGGM